MDLYIVPIILAGLLSLTVADTSALIQMTFVVAGLATIIQSRCLLKPDYHYLTATVKLSPILQDIEV